MNNVDYAQLQARLALIETDVRHLTVELQSHKGALELLQKTMDRLFWVVANGK
jgi:hypothetical protein